MEFLKELFKEKALTFDEFKAAVEGKKELKLVNLADGGYVAKEKFDAKETELKNTNTQLEEANKQIESFKGMDVEGIKQAANEWKTKYEEAQIKSANELKTLKLEHAVDRALLAAKVKNPKIAKSALDLTAIKLDGDDLLGLKEQIEKLKESDGYLFEESENEKKENTTSFKVDSGGKHGSGENPDYDKMSDDEYYKTVFKKEN